MPGEAVRAARWVRVRGGGAGAGGVGVGGRVEDGMAAGDMAAGGVAAGGMAAGDMAAGDMAADDMAAGESEGAARYETGDGRMVVLGPLNTSGKGRSVKENVDAK